MSASTGALSHTLDGLHRHSEEIRKSRFEAIAGPVDSAEQALQFIADHSQPDATHNCWAYRIGGNYRFSDDGEPGGTAGRPILQALDGQQCDHVVVLVARWFGGIKLGTGGLMRAYGGVAAQCLRLAAKTPLVPKIRLRCHCGFSEMALVRSRLAACEAVVMEENYDADGVWWHLELPQAHAESFREQFINLTRGQGRIQTD